MDGGVLVTAGVGLGGIAGTFLGSVLGKRAERDAAHAAWLRERRLEIYTEYLAAGHAL